MVVQAAEPVSAPEIQALLRTTERQAEKALQTLRASGWVVFEAKSGRRGHGFWRCVENRMPFMGGTLEIRGIPSGSVVKRVIVMDAKPL